MEVAGLILGALPLAIQAFQRYRTILSSIRHTKRDLETMILDLQGEVLILQNTCEALLRGIASDSEIESMIQNPYSDAWTKYSDEVRLRVWTSERFFCQRFYDMMLATAELEEKLAIGSHGKMRLTDRASVLAELKRKTSFTLRKREYVDILSRLHKGNVVLSLLAAQNRELEPSRWSRSQTRAASLIRRLSSGIFSAVQGAVTCRCIGKHNVGLVMSQRKLVMLPDDQEEDAARKFHFDVILGTYGENSQRWDGMQVKVAEKEGSPCVRIHEPARSAAPERRPGLSSFLSIGPAKVESVPSLQNMPPSRITASKTNTALPRFHITDLCHVLKEDQRVSPNYYGYIDGSSNKFDLYHQDRPPSCRGAITLREILKARRQSISTFGHPERLKLALTLSFGVLHLYSTPWLSKAVTLDDIVFLHGKNTAGHDDYYLDRPFLAKQLADASQPTQAASSAPAAPHLMLPPQTSNTYRPIEPWLLSLGLLLIQIIIGEHVEELCIGDGMSLDGILEKQNIAFGMTHLVVQNGSSHYAAAVQWCLQNFLSVTNWDSTELAQQFYNGVISRLESAMI